MSLSPGLILTLALSAAGPDWRYAAEPADAAETELQAIAARPGDQKQAALLDLSRRNPETLVSGLARLTAGLSLLEAGRYSQAIAELSHPDVQRTSARDHALLAIGRAQEALGQSDAAARAYLAAAAEPSSAVACDSRPKAAELLLRARQLDAAVAALDQMAAGCPGDLSDTLLALGEAHLARGDGRSAAAVFDRLDREFPTSAQATAARARLASLASHLPPRPAEERARLLLQRGEALLKTGKATEAIEALRAVALPALPKPEADEARINLARALLSRGRTREGERLLREIGPDSPHVAQAAFLAARERARHSPTPEAFELVADRHRGTPWGEEALLAAANHYQKDALDDAALPFWRRLLVEYPYGKYVERAAWRTGWADHIAGRHQAAALTFESAARLRPPSSTTAGFLYWAGRSRIALHQDDLARRLLEETVQRYKHTYHGLRAAEALSRLGGASTPQPVVSADGASGEPALPEPRATRLRQLLLVDRIEEAAQELRLAPQSSRVDSTLAWIDWRRGRYRSALVTMKRAHPEWIGEAGDRLPADIWRIFYPLGYENALRSAAEEEALDPALVAALVLQESSFDPAARSRAGARGLMQVMPYTGLRIARAKGRRFVRAALHDPETSLDFGTHYLRSLSDRFEGSVERVLAAYNAGPHRVDAWTAERPPKSAEEFIESIPFSETRNYVMIVLANREEYRRLYGLTRRTPEPAAGGARP